MTYSPPGENTLGIILGRGKRREADATRRVIRAATPLRSSLGLAFIGVGAIAVTGLLVAHGLIWLVVLWDSYPDPMIALAAWIILILALLATIVSTRATVGELPHWMFALFLLGLAVSMGLDFIAIWPLHDIGGYATASATAGSALLVVIVVRRVTDILVSTAVIAAVFVTCIVLNSSLTPETSALQVTTLALAVVPPVIGVVLVRGFRRLVQVELDRVLVQSTVSAPRFAVGMMASEELARLDLAAEELLEAVATGRAKLPLNPRTASVAASLATELRLHLIEGRRETWLYHAITESDLLGRAVTLTDKGSLAGLLDPRQRDGLLSAVWLLVSDTGKSATRSVQIAVEPVASAIDSGYGRKITIAITLTVTGITRNKVDPAAWEALRKIGSYSDSTQNSQLQVDVACLVDNPAEQ